ncbi:hypothetical protein [Abyssisolibacter fermentans]|uniref:hypothetical protein n=1 Tax=Abyssisolibacter fermentans TaxID=1766203 RepID=UPI00082CE814|nr:hypothetical protein [Abyssisolibacter fermentans]
MKKFCTEDVFKTARIIKKYKATEIIKYFTNEYKQEDMSEEEAGLNAIINIASDQKIEKAFYEIVAIPLEVESKDVKMLPVDELIDGLIELNKEQNLIRFFNLAGRLSLK